MIKMNVLFGVAFILILPIILINYETVKWIFNGHIRIIMQTMFHINTLDDMGDAKCVLSNPFQTKDNNIKNIHDNICLQCATETTVEYEMKESNIEDIQTSAFLLQQPTIVRNVFTIKNTTPSLFLKEFISELNDVTPEVCNFVSSIDTLDLQSALQWINSIQYSYLQYFMTWRCCFIEEEKALRRLYPHPNLLPNHVSTLTQTQVILIQGKLDNQIQYEINMKDAFYARQITGSMKLTLDPPLYCKYIAHHAHTIVLNAGDTAIYFSARRTVMVSTMYKDGVTLLSELR